MLAVSCFSRLSLGDFAALDAVGANADALGRALDHRMHSLQIWAPAAPGYVVGVRDVVTKLRAFAANVAYLCHDLTPKSSKTVPAWDRAAREDAFYASERFYALENSTTQKDAAR